MVLLSIFYYGIVILGLLIYLIYREKDLSMSDFIVLGNTVLFSFAGVANSYGWVEGYNSFDSKIFILYVLNSLIVPIGITLGKRLKIYKQPSLSRTDISDGLLYIIIIFVIVYSAGFFFIIRDSIPLIMAFTGSSPYEIAVARLRVTHNFSQYYSVPFIYNYRGLVFSFGALYSFSVLFIKYLNNKYKYRLVFWFYFAVVFFLQFYATEKVPLIYLIIIIVVDLYLVKVKYIINDFQDRYITIENSRTKKKIKRRIVSLAILGVVGLVFSYTLFMGVESFYEGFGAMMKRAFIQQSSSIYLQKMTLDQAYNGCLFGKGVSLTIIDSLIGREPVNLSKLAYSTQYASYIKDGGAGSAGSLGIFDLYSNYGLFFAGLILLCITMTTGWLDKKTSIKIEHSESKELPIAYYSMLTYVFFQGFLGHYQTFFQLPFIVAPSLFIILLMTYVFRKVH